MTEATTTTGTEAGGASASQDTSPYAGIVSRGIAIVIDAATLAVVFSFFTGAAGLVLSLFTAVDTTNTAAVLGAVGTWAVLVTLYFTLCWSAGGQTLGMRLMGLRVTRQGDADASPRVLRSLARFLVLSSSLGLLFPGLLLVLVHPRRRALHDLAGGTVVRYDSTGERSRDGEPPQAR